MPVYNSAKTLSESVESVLSQSFRDFELICKNDGSTDESEEILKNYRQKDDRIVILKQNNSGAGAARNKGLEASKGKYITFLDSDDLFAENALKKLYDSINTTNADLVRAIAYTKKEETVEKLDWSLDSQVPFNQPFNWETIDDIFSISAGQPWGMIVSKELIDQNNIQFLELRRSEDLYFTYLCYACAKKIIAIDEYVVEYRPQTTGMESTKTNYPLDSLKSRELLKERLVKLGVYEGTKNSFWYRGLISYFEMLDRLVKNNQLAEASEYYQEIRNAINELGIESKSYFEYPNVLKRIFPKIRKVILTKNIKEYKDLSGVSIKYDYKFNLGIQPIVSIIMPVKNTELFIRQCINSILNQTLQNFELICVDDGSDDSTPEILDGYQSRYPDKIRVIHNKASNAGVCRNIGMRYAHGKYLLFLDSDDTFKNTMLEKAVRALDESWADVLIFGGNVYNNKTKQYYKAEWLLRWEFVISKQFKPTDISNYLFQITTPNPWNKMYRSNYIWDNNIQFQSNMRANDVFFTYYALANAKKITVLNEQLVNWRTNNPHSLQGSNSQTPTCFLKAYTKLHDELVLEGIYEEYEQSFINVLISNVCYTLESTKTFKSTKELLKQAKVVLNGYKIQEYDKSYFYEPEKYEKCLKICNMSVKELLREKYDLSFGSIVRNIKTNGVRNSIRKYM